MMLMFDRFHMHVAKAKAAFRVDDVRVELGY